MRRASRAAIICLKAFVQPLFVRVCMGDGPCEHHYDGLHHSALARSVLSPSSGVLVPSLN